MKFTTPVPTFPEFHFVIFPLLCKFSITGQKSSVCLRFFYTAVSANQKFQPILRSSEVGLSKLALYYSKRHFWEIATKKPSSWRMLTGLQPSRINDSLQDLRWTYVIFILCIPFCYMTKQLKKQTSRCSKQFFIILNINSIFITIYIIQHNMFRPLWVISMYIL